MRFKKDVFSETVGHVTNHDSETYRETRIYPFELSATDTRSIIAACKYRKVSVQAAIQAAASKAMSEIVLNAAKQKGIAVESLRAGDMTTSASLLKHLKYYGAECLENQIGNFTFNIKDKVDIVQNAQGEFWDLVQRNHDYLRGNVYRGLKAANVNDILAVYLFQERFDLAHKYARNLLQFTNYGNVNYLNDQYNDLLKITGSYSGIGIHHIGPTFSNFITSVNGRMFWGVLYVPMVTNLDMVKRYSQRCAHILVENCSNVISKQV